MKLTYLGHSCFTLRIANKVILFDPFIRANELASGINFNSIHADYILVSHGHSDHTADLVDLARNTGAKVVSSFEIHTWLNNQGIENTHPMNIGGKWLFEFGTLHMVFAAHSNSLPDGTYGGVAAGFVIETSEMIIYYAGDTALTTDMRLLAEKFTINTALLPIGDNFTMDYKDACKASDFINCNKIIAMHFDTFGYIKINHKEAIDYFTNNNKQLIIPTIGNTIEL
ncbi:MAG: metal-dependent hydrolase [Bacteroidia bacterium]|nr:metal-dependent hydrolase [Bacteroidia bacterium]